MAPFPVSRRRALGTAAGVGAALPALAACSGENAPAEPGPTTAPSETPADAEALTALSEIPIGGGVILDEIVVTQPTKGDFRGFSAICTHQGCIVREVTATINCFCHGAKYSLESGAPVSGPANTALAPRELRIEGEDLYLAQP